MGCIADCYQTLTQISDLLHTSCHPSWQQMHSSVASVGTGSMCNGLIQRYVTVGHLMPS